MFRQRGFLGIEELRPSEGDLPSLLALVADVIFLILGLLAVIYLIYGGVTYITAGGDAEKAGKGRVAITNAIIGVIIIILSFAIYRYVIGAIG